MGDDVEGQGKSCRKACFSAPELALVISSGKFLATFRAGALGGRPIKGSGRLVGEPFYLLSSTYADLAADNISFLLHQAPGTNAPIPALAQLWYIEDGLIDSLWRCLLFIRTRR